MALFDNMRKNVVAITEKVFGDVATWLDSEGAVIFEGLVYYADAEKIASLGDTEIANYSPYDIFIEYSIDQFQGLKNSVDSGNIEKLTIKEAEFLVRSIVAIADGNMFIAKLQKKTV